MWGKHQDGLALEIFEPCLLSRESGAHQQRRQKKQ
jgi:hypothetical protein